MKIIRLFSISAVLFLLPNIVSAQFFLGGDDPGGTVWSSMESRNYRIIYPSGLDSTARSYVMELEKYRIPVSRSAGYAPGEMTRSRMPVVLHPYSALSNGSVAWAPKRMDLYSTPSGYKPEPMPWTEMLAIHESRHVAQMQFGISHCLRPFRYVFGEMANGALAGIYPDKWLLEGDAVVAETALSRSGRGRVADFMNYYRIAFDDGDFRNADRWAYGSYWHNTPDYYAFGYMVLSGIRYMYDVPDFSGQLFRHYARRPYDIVARNTVSKELTGKKFRELVDESMKLYHDIWTEDAENRAPFLPYTRLSEDQGIFTEYGENLIIDDELYFPLTQRDFFDMIDKTSFAVASDDSRHFLTGVYMEKKDDKLAMVATDGKRMAYVCRMFEQGIPDFPPAIMTVRFLSLLRSIGSGEGLFSLGVKEGYIFAKLGNRTIYSSLIQGTYAAYEKVIPRNLENTAVLKKEDAEKAISLISILVEKNSKRIFLDLRENRIIFSGENTEFGESHQEIPASYSGPDVRISFNCSLLLSPIKKINSDYIRIMFSKPSSAMIFTSDPEKDYLFVLMPMQLS